MSPRVKNSALRSACFFRKRATSLRSQSSSSAARSSSGSVRCKFISEFLLQRGDEEFPGKGIRIGFALLQVRDQLSLKCAAGAAKSLEKQILRRLVQAEA